MATTPEALLIRIEATQAKFEKQMAAINARGVKTAKDVEKNFLLSNKNIEHSFDFGRDAFKGILLGVGPALLGVASFEGAIEGAKAAVEAFSKINDESKASGLDAEFFQSIAYQAKLGGVGIDQISASLETFNKNSGLAVAGRGKMFTALKALDPELLKNIQLASTQEERIKLVADAIAKETDKAKAAAISTSAFGEAGQKLVDVFSTGAAGIDKMVASAKEMGIIVPDELISRADELGDKFDTATTIIDMQFKQALVELAPWLVSTAGGIAGIAKAIGVLVDNSKDISERVLIKPLQTQLVDIENQRALLLDAIRTQQAETDNMPDTWAFGIPNLQKSGNQAAIDGMKKQAEDLMQLALPLQNRVDQLLGMDQPPVKPPATGGGNSGTGGTTQTDGQKFGTDIEQFKLRTQAVKDQTAAQSELNPLVDDYGFTVTRLKAIEELENDALKHHIALTPDLKKSIEELATGYATAQVEAAKLAKSQQEIAKTAEDIRGTAKDVFKSFIGDLLQGNSAAEALGNALTAIGSKLLEIGANKLFDSGSSGGSDILGSLINAVLGGGGGTGKTFSSPAAWAGLPGNASGTDNWGGGLTRVNEKGGEIMNLPNGTQIIPHDISSRMAQASASRSGGITVHYAPQIDATGADQAAIVRLDRALARDRAEFRANWVRAARDLKKGRLKIN